MVRFVFSRWHLATIFALSFLLLVALSTAVPVHAGGTVLDCDNDSAFSSLLAGGGLVTFNCGNAHLAATIALSSTKTISANTTIDGGGNITLSGGFGYRLFVVNNGVTLTLQNITLINGYNPDILGGAGVRNNGHLILDHVTIHTMVDSAFNGGAIGTIGAVDITNSTFYDNKATNGGAIFANGSAAVVSISNSVLYENKATGTGSNGMGGAIYVTNGAYLNLDSSNVYTNTGKYGGGIYNDTSTTNLTNVTMMYDKASSGGGAIYNKGTLSVQNSNLSSNRTDYGNGGGIYTLGIANLADVTLAGNSSSYGGGVANDHGDLTMIGGTVSGNSANVAGGGGIASSYGTMTLTNLTVSNNFASGDAGGVENGRGTAYLTNMTLSGNYASSGGGMWNLFGGTAYLTNVTIFGNSGLSSAGGIGNSNDPDTHLYLKNVIVAKSKQGDNCVFQKAPDSSDSNLSSDATCNFGVGRDSVKMKLGSLETNGGSMLTHRLLPGSPAIDNGVFVNTILTDQRGITRPRGAVFDVGAVEFVPCVGTPDKPVLLAPRPKPKLITQTVLLDWAGPDCVKTFSVVVRQGSKTGPIVFSKGKTTRTQVTTTMLAKNQKYFWQVTVCNGAGCAASSWGKFQVK